MSGEWYEDGLRFECTQCGACCTGAPGYVNFSEAEGRAIAARLGVLFEEFLMRYTVDHGSLRSLAEVKTRHGYDCVFLDRATMPGKAVCTLYGDRPLQCRTFPFWPENLKSASAWKRAARECEGIGRGGFVAIEDIRIQRDAQQARDATIRH
ncbi:MAG: YkgJ family cysteine cluster protein [Phycisphaerales bacterium]